MKILKRVDSGYTTLSDVLQLLVKRGHDTLYYYVVKFPTKCEIYPFGEPFFVSTTNLTLLFHLVQ